MGRKKTPPMTASWYLSHIPNSPFARSQYGCYSLGPESAKCLLRRPNAPSVRSLLNLTSHNTQVCTIKAFPSEIAHCIQWAKEGFNSKFCEAPMGITKLVGEGADAFREKVKMHRHE